MEAFRSGVTAVSKSSREFFIELLQKNVLNKFVLGSDFSYDSL